MFGDYVRDERTNGVKHLPERHDGAAYFRSREFSDVDGPSSCDRSIGRFVIV